MSRWTLSLITAPTFEPISLQEAKDQARIVQTQGDANVYRYIRTAREAAEEFMNRGLVTQTWQLGLWAFDEENYLPRAHPLQNGTLTKPVVQYYDVDGVLQTLAEANYLVDTYSRPGKISRAPGYAWPPVQADRRAPSVLITYTIGWTTAALVPERIKQGLRLYIAWLDRDRDGSEPGGDLALVRAQACWTDVLSYIEPCEAAPWA